MCQNNKRTANLPALTGLLLQGQECQQCYRTHSVGSQLQDGLAGYLQDHRQNTSDKAALWGGADIALRILLWVEGWRNGPASWTIRPCYRGKHFPIITSTLRAQKGLCWAGIVKLTIICRPTSSATAKYLSYQAISEQLLDIPNRQ